MSTGLRKVKYEDWTTHDSLHLCFWQQFRNSFKQIQSDYCLHVEGSDLWDALPLCLDSIIIPFEMENGATSVAVAGTSGESG